MKHTTNTCLSDMILMYTQGDLTDLEATLKSSKTVLEGLAGAEAIVYSAYYRAASEYHKVTSHTHSLLDHLLADFDHSFTYWENSLLDMPGQVVGPPEAFYKNALMFLAYTPVESLPADEK